MSTIAIIEDETSIAELYRMKFEREGFTVKVATNGIEGLRLLRQVQADLVMLDIRMPKMSGDEMLKKLRTTEWGAGLRVIVLTNLSRQEAPASLQFLNVERYIVKANHTPSQIVEIVREVLGEHR